MKWPWVSRRKYEIADAIAIDATARYGIVRATLHALYNRINRGEKPDRTLMREVERVLKL